MIGRRKEGEGQVNLAGALIRGTDLSGANLVGAFQVGANLRVADLSTAKLEGQGQLGQACGTDAKLPPGLTLRPCQ